jgi:hypothetical protein
MLTASFTCTAAELESATDYRTGDGVVLRIAHRERCPACAGIVRIVTAADADGKPRQATFVRLHLHCVGGPVFTGWSR